MAKQYQWRATAHYNGPSAPDTTLTYGSTAGQYQNWQNKNVGEQGSGTWGYYYHDANVGVYDADYGGLMWTDANASRVITSLVESWTTSVDHLNNLTVRITQKIDSVVRDECYGQNTDTPGRGIAIYREDGGAQLLSLTDYQVATPHVIWNQGMQLDEYTFTLAPGQNLERSSLYLHNWTLGEEDHYDDIWMGIQFRNTLPAPDTYTLTYNANGGSGAPSQQSYTTADPPVNFIISNGTPSWGLYEFLGWSTIQYTDSRTEADVEYRAGDTITLQQSNRNVILYAVWRKDYRPGAIFDNTAWQSHNRTGGECHVLNGSTWQEMRTIGAPTAMGNPPSVYKDGKWYNMARIGKGKG